MTISPNTRQFLIAVTSQLSAVSVGGAVTFPTLLIEQFRTSEMTQLDTNTKTWIGSMYGLAGIPAILVPILAQAIGRKWGYITACLCIVLGWITAYIATTTTEILISQFFHGLGTNSLVLVCYIALSEMLAPKYRHTSLQAYGIAQGVGMAACGILGRYMHYKMISIVMLVPMLTAVALALTWLESPSWLACRGDFEKCERAFIKLRGVDAPSMKELLELITAQKENLSCSTRVQFRIQTFWKTIIRRDFYVPSIHVFIVYLLMYWGGNDAVYVYFIEIVKAYGETVIYYASIMMYVTVLGGFSITIILVNKFKNKTVIICSAAATVVCLLISGFISSLQTLGVLSENSLLLVYSLIAYMASSYIGLHSTVFAISVELMPVKHRSVGGALLIIFRCILYASSLKLSPYITHNVGLWCTFLIYAINTILCLLFISKYVPETKGRSLQEIEDYYMFGGFIQRNKNESSHLQTQRDNTNAGQC